MREGTTSMCRCPHRDHEQPLADAPALLLHTLEHLIRMENTMTEFANDQAHLDADVQAETDSLTAVEAEIAALKAQPAATALDFTALDAATARLKGDAPAVAVPAPVDVPPAPPVA
jgi:transposase